MELKTALEEALKRYERAHKLKLDDALAKMAWKAEVEALLTQLSSPSVEVVDEAPPEPTPVRWMCVEELQAEMGVPEQFHTQGEQQAVSRQVYRKIHNGPLAVYHQRQIYRAAGKKGSDRYHYSGPVLDLIREEITKRMERRRLTVTGESLQPTLDPTIFPTITLPSHLSVPARP